MLIEVKNVSVDYITGDIQNMGLKDFVIKKIKGEYTSHTFKALNNISFSVDKGDMVGIIGGNGAGKSTLLKVITGILPALEGTVKVNGNISALLELASGFDSELTVRENVFLRGAMLGYTRQFMQEKYESIIAFSELREFEDRSFKQLSSGMKSRIAFSIACLINPEILILDEVLSVGDGNFRRKSEEKMLEVINGGTATLMVSHSLSQIQRLCNKVLWLNKGRQIAFGDAKEICDIYSDFTETRKLY